jgi:hypothetical protein
VAFVTTLFSKSIPHFDAEIKLLQQFVVFVKGVLETTINNLSISLDITVF